MRVGEFYPPEGHDFVPSSVIRKLSNENGSALEAVYSDRVAVFRADVILKLMQHSAINSGYGWALFYVDLIQDPGDLSFIDDRLEVFFGMRAVRNTYQSPRPVIRVITSHTTRIETGFGIVTEDITVDNDGDSQYYLSAATLTGPNPEFDGKPTLSPFVIPQEDGTVMLANCDTYTPIYEVCDSSEDSTDIQSAMPFGHFSCYEDKLFALTKARDIFSKIVKVQPERQHYPG